MSHDSTDSFLFEDLFDKPLLARFDSQLRTSNAGLALLAGVDRRSGLTERLASCLVDRRDPSRVQHTTCELLRQRVYSIALGCPDTNDASQMSTDPAVVLAYGRSLRRGGEALGSQPTLSRFERAASGREVVAMQRQLESFAVERLRKRHQRPQRIFIDLDPTVDPTRGQQVFSEFNGHDDTWCYLPMLGFLGVEGDPERHLFHARPGGGLAKEMQGTVPLLQRIVESLRRTFEKARICVRLDGGFASPRLFDLLDDLKVESVGALSGNARLQARSSLDMGIAGALARSLGRTISTYNETRYAARSWRRERRVVFKAEVVCAPGKLPRANDRYVVTNLRWKARSVWKLYCQRGDSENRIKELKGDLAMDRTSCTSFLANQMRVLMTAAAYVLFQELRAALHRTELERALVGTLRLRLLKVGATITESVRRIVISMPTSHPWKDLWRRAAAGVVSGHQTAIARLSSPAETAIQRESPSRARSQDSRALGEWRS